MPTPRQNKPLFPQRIVEVSMKVFLFGFIISIFPAFAATGVDNIPTGRLSTDVRPVAYNLALTIDPSRDEFTGTSTIQLEINKPSKVMWIHGRDLTAKKTELILQNNEAIPATYKQMNEDGVVGLEFSKLPPAGKATLEIEYSAKYPKGTQGLFKVEEGGNAYAFTQFESFDARRCFPGFDEPAFKTPFDISITVKAQDQAIANTLPAKVDQLPNGMKTFQFHRTQNLPTYLIALAVGPMDIVDASDIPPNTYRKSPLPLRGVALKGKGNQMQYSLNHTGEMVILLEKYFEIGFPYEKLDIIAIPGFGGAMENAGAITFGEDLLLFDEKTSSASQRRSYANVMAHELAHQWFGDLVTMPWWDDIWLNEAFATWMASKIVQQFNPTYRANISSINSSLYAMSQDSLVSARQIRQPIESSHDILNAFDSITYSKGGAVLSMFERYTGASAFQKGIHHYLMKYASGNATTDQFLAAVSEGSGKPISEAFHTFLFQPGVPFLTITSSCKSNKTSLTVEQKRYLPLGSKGNPNQIWQTPACIRYSQNHQSHDQCILLKQAMQTIDLETNACPDWIMPNADGAGYYKWTIDPATFERLKNAGLSPFTIREQLSIADNVISSFKNGTLSAKDAFQILEPFATSSDRFIAVEPMELIEFYHENSSDPELVKKVQEYGRRLYAPAFAKLGFASKASDESEDTQMLRSQVIDFLAITAEDPIVREQAKKEALSLEIERLDPNLRETILTVAAQEQDLAYTQKLIQEYKKSTQQLIREEILYAVGSARNPAAIQEARELLSDPTIRPTEMLQILYTLSKDPSTRESNWEWFKQDFGKIYSLIPSGSIFYAGSLPYVAVGFCSRNKAKEVQQFFDKKIQQMPGGPRNLAQVVERIELCAARWNAQEKSAREFLDAK
jgi:aminopeptidase N